MEEENYEKELKKYKRKNFIALIIEIVLITFIVIVGFIFFIESANNNSRHLDDPLGMMTPREIDAFNTEWTSYEGNQKGLQVKALLSSLMANAKTYQEEPEKILEIEFVGEAETKNIIYNYNSLKYEESLNEYIDSVNEIYNEIKTKHNYNVSTEISVSTSLINKIIIEY